MSQPAPSLTRLFPGATTAIVVGPLTAPPEAEFQACRAVLWISAGAHGATTPNLPPPPRLRLLALDEATPAALEAFVRLDPRHLPSLHVTPQGLADPRHAPLLDQLTALLADHHRARVTRQQDAFRWQSHLLRNLPHYAASRWPEAWRGWLAGWPAFVCGAGPSLDVSAPRLAACAGGGVVLAADSALHTLARHGIAADFVVSIDVAKQPAKCLPATHRPRRAVLSAVSPPDWHEALPSPAPVYVSNRQLTLDWLHTQGVNAPAAAASESCGSTALELARFLGCAPIFVFGLDLALSQTQRHTTGADPALYTQSGFDAGQRHPEVPGNYAERVPSHASGDWRELNARLATWPAGLVYNVTDRGARLSQTTVVHPADFTPPEPRAGAAERLAALPAPEPAPQQAWAQACAQLRDAGARAAATVPAAQAALATGGPGQVAAVLRPLLVDPLIGRMLGGFSLKIMPHLLPPIEGTTAEWQVLIEELGAIARLARDLR